MERRNFLRMAACAAAAPMALSIQAKPKPAGKKPNILFITVDDMNCDSVGVFGAEMPGTTPRLDRLAAEGVRFEHAHVQVANCVPSRNVMQTGRYPHTSGVEGFYKVHPPFPILPGRTDPPDPAPGFVRPNVTSSSSFGHTAVVCRASRDLCDRI